MNWIEQVIEEFGRRIGIPRLAVNTDGRLRLEAADQSSIGIFHKGAETTSEVIVYRTIQANYLTAGQYRAALRMANYSLARPWPLQFAYDQRELIIAFRIPERAFLLNDLEKALDDLGEISNQIKGIL